MCGDELAILPPVERPPLTASIQPLKDNAGGLVSSGLITPSTILKFDFNGAPSLQPEGLRPTLSLSTLDCAVTGQQPKTRYWVQRVITSQAGLPPASTSAPRGAQSSNPNSGKTSLPDVYGKRGACRYHSLCVFQLNVIKADCSLRHQSTSFGSAAHKACKFQ